MALTSPLPNLCTPPEEKGKEEKGREEEGGSVAPKAKDKEGGDPKPRPLHKTCSLFMRNIAPNISQAEIVAVSSWGAGLSGGCRPPKIPATPS